MKESDIRPKEFFEEYLRLSLKDAERITRNDLVEIDCPACHTASEKKSHLTKNGFSYKLCSSCGSLYCSPRPSEQSLNNFYKKSISSDYWAKTFFPAVAEARRNKLFRPKAEKVNELIIQKKTGIQKICDVGAGYGIFLEELNKINPDIEIFAVEPGDELARVCEQKEIPVLQSRAEDAEEWYGRFDLVISSEVIEHVFSPEKFIISLSSLAKKNGVVLITGLGYEGFDILTLGEKSNSIFPPHHLNFLSLKGFQKLFENCGLMDIEIITPGELDLDIVLSNGIENEFVRVLQSRGEIAQKDFQKFLQKYKMSSHVWVWGLKK